MERVAFLVEDTNVQLRCMLNPENLVLKRHAGLTLSDYSADGLSGTGNAGNALLFNGGGFTELDLDLLFDVTLSSGSSIISNDVRELTGPIWQLSENARGDPSAGKRPPVTRFVWGKTWNIRGVVKSVAERLENFGPTGIPRRSWLRLKLLELPDDGDRSKRQSLMSGAAASGAGHVRSRTHQAENPKNTQNETILHRTAETGEADGAAVVERLDQLAERYYGNASLWRVIAAANTIEDPGALPPGVLIEIPPLPQS